MNPYWYNPLGRYNDYKVYDDKNHDDIIASCWRSEGKTKRICSQKYVCNESADNH